MFGYARILIADQAIYVRFERVGDSQRFNALMDRFNHSFPLKGWQEQKRAWQLPAYDLNALIEFCRATFGPSGYLLQKENTTKSPERQMRSKSMQTVYQ